MKGVTFLPATRRISGPWKNGGGVTYEVAAFPPGSGPAAFLWRISIAEIKEAAHFSMFPGIDRILTMLDGTLKLTVSEEAVTLCPQSPPYPFSGDVAAAGEPLMGHVRDLNVMVARGRWRASIVRIGPAHRQTVVMTAHSTVLISRGEAEVHLREDQKALRLAPLDAVQFDALVSSLTLTTEAPVLVVGLDPISSAEGG
ncbi:MAG: HutD family protein [Sphingobium sp.]